MLELADIHRSFKVGPGRMPILNGVSLSVAKGELVSVMGGSGSGKTTLMNIIGLLDKPSSGTYAVEGQDVLRAQADDLSRLRNRLIGCHLHDTIWPNQDHHLPGDGSIDYDRLMPLVPPETFVIWELSPKRKEEDVRRARAKWLERFG